VDNGPKGQTRRRNDMLYSPAGLQASRDALRRGGVLAVWSAHASEDFTRRLERAGFEVTEVDVNALPDGGEVHHHIWFARKP